MTIVVIVKSLISNRKNRKEVKTVDKLKSMNYWNKQVESRFPRSAQAVLQPNTAATKTQGATSSCGQGSCNCGGGCNGECSTSCES